MDKAIRTHLLGYVVDADGALPVAYLQALVAERVLPKYLQDYDPQTEHWSDTWEAVVYRLAVRHYIETSSPITLTVLRHKLPTAGVVGENIESYVGATERALLLKSTTPLTVSNLSHYIGELRLYRSYYDLQQLMLRADELMKTDPKAGIELLQQNLADIAVAADPNDKIWDFQAMATSRWERHMRFASMENIRGQDTGLVSYDESSRGMLPGELMVVAGRTSVGKTVVLQHAAAKTVFNQNKRAIYVSSEMGWSDEHNALMDRFEAMATGFWQSGQLRWGNIDPNTWEYLHQWFDWFAHSMQGNLFVIPPQRCATIGEVVTEVRSIARKGKIDLLCVDYINEITSGVKEAYLDKRNVTRGLMRLGEELQCPVIAAAQTSRYGHQRGEDADAGELMSESEYIAKVADTVLQISRDRLDRNRLIFKVMKARHGRAGWSFGCDVDWAIPCIGGGWSEEETEITQRARKRANQDKSFLNDIPEVK